MGAELAGGVETTGLSFTHDCWKGDVSEETLVSGIGVRYMQENQDVQWIDSCPDAQRNLKLTDVSRIAGEYLLVMSRTFWLWQRRCFAYENVGSSALWECNSWH